MPNPTTPPPTPPCPVCGSSTTRAFGPTDRYLTCSANGHVTPNPDSKEGQS